ncbi:MAG TPA: carboxypeptidase regulatory-like domain-containing protein [Patescibacteria group bacterium]
MFVSLEGTVTYKESGVGLEGVTIELTQGTKKFTTTTNNKGYYKFPTISGDEFSHLQATKPKFKPYNYDLDLVSGTNTHNFTMRFSNDNEVDGMTYEMDHGAKKPLGGITVVAENVDSTDSDDKTGEYELWDQKFVKGTYKLWAEDQKGKLSDVYTITFTEDTDQVITQDIEIKRKPDNRYVLRVAAFDRGWWVRDGTEPIEGVNVTLEGTLLDGKKQTTTQTTDKKGIATFTDLKEGTYKATGQKVNYWDGKGTITLSGKPDIYGYDLEIFLLVTGVTCEKHSQTSVKEFWFCGKEAIDLYTKRQDLWTLIDNKISQVRGSYPQAQYADMPQQVVIDSISYNNAFFYKNTEKYNGTCPISPLDDDPGFPLTADTIVFTTGALLKESTLSTEHTVTHEMGHNIDWRKGNCKDEYSDSPPFKDVYWLGETLYGDDYFYGLKDSNYGTNETGGHPNDNYHEGFASTVHAYLDHIGEFPKMRTAIDQLKEILLKTASLTGAV